MIYNAVRVDGHIGSDAPMYPVSSTNPTLNSEPIEFLPQPEE